MIPGTKNPCEGQTQGMGAVYDYRSYKSSLRMEYVCENPFCGVPARIIVSTQELHFGCLVEIEAVAECAQKGAES